jgi:hypothetical protein
MWGQYAASNTGFLIQFDATHPWFKQGPVDDKNRHVRKVKYVNFEESSAADFQTPDFIYTKSSQWEYEREWRMVWPLKDCYRKLPHDVYLFGVPPSSILKVVLGVRSTPQFETELNGIMQKNIRLRPIPVIRANIDASSNTIRVKPRKEEKFHWPI